MKPGPGISKEALELTRSAVVVDLHADTLFLVFKAGLDLRRRHRNPLPRSPFALHVDIPRLKEGGVDAIGLALPLPSFERARRGDRIERSLDEVRRWQEGLDGEFPMVDSVSAILSSKSDGKPCFFLTLEGAHGVPADPAKLGGLRKKGLGAVTLAHLTPSRAAFPSTLGTWSRRPLPEAGARLIAAMEEARIVVDLAHLGERGVKDALSLCTRPPVVSHTGLAGVRPMWRNISDEAVKRVAGLGGVVGVIFHPGFHVRRPFAGLDCVVRSIRHLLDLVGEDFVALGSDFDGWVPSMPRGLEDASALPALTDALLRCGLAHGTIEKILGANALRVLGEVWGS